MSKSEKIKNAAQARLIRRLSKKSGLSESFVYTALSFGIIGAYDLFNSVKRVKQ